MAARLSPAEPSGAGSARPGIGRLSLIALACFAVGLAWPLLAGIDFVQRPPGSAPTKPGENDPPPLDSEPDSKPSAPPPTRPGAPVKRDEGVRAAAHTAPIARASEPGDDSDG